jgi:hypothetical protein
LRRWLVKIEYFTPAKGLRHWEGEIEATTVEEANDLAMEAFRRGRPGRNVPEIADIRMRRVKGGSPQ